MRDSCRTIHSFIINSTDHIKHGKSYERLSVDEALIVHAGEIIFALKLSGAKELLMIGDANQSTFINRPPTCDTKFFDILQKSKKTTTLNHSYRTFITATALIFQYYEKLMTTRNETQKEMSKLPLSMLKHVQINNPDQKVLVFKQLKNRNCQTLDMMYPPNMDSKVNRHHM